MGYLAGACKVTIRADLLGNLLSVHTSPGLAEALLQLQLCAMEVGGWRLEIGGWRLEVGTLVGWLVWECTGNCAPRRDDYLS